MTKRTFLVTGAAGFIGMHAAIQLLNSGHDVVGVDVVNDYYDPNLKEDRLNEVSKASQNSSGVWTFYRIDIADKAMLSRVFATHTFDRVIHLAAQAGVRHSLDHPEEYVHSNIVGFLNILESCRQSKTPHLIYASTSSVYGANKKTPFSEADAVDHPVQFYAATKRANELMAHAYSTLYGLPTTGLRFFTVYGPWGRPDMAPILFANAIRASQVIKLFNYGNHSRDFTYVDDIVDGTLRAAETIPTARQDQSALSEGPAASNAPFQIFNIGNSQPANLSYFIELIEREMGQTAERKLLPMQPGDVKNTYADISALSNATGYSPSVSLETGVAKFIRWYKSYYGAAAPD